MVAITKQLFTEIIESLRDQYDYDVATINILEKALKTDALLMYDNSKLTESLFKVLEAQFPLKSTYIKEFCYQLDFGRILNPDSAIEELWKELSGEKTWYETTESETKKLFETKTSIVNINEIEVKDFTVVSPLKDKKYSIADE